MPIEYLSAQSLPVPRFRYSPCVQAGPWRQVSGMIALHPKTGELEAGGAGAETRRILQNLCAALPEWGVELSDLVIARIYTTRFDRFAEINAAWEDVFGVGVVPPARTSVGVAALPLNASVEIEFSFWRERAR
jgi:2-iminobutanoate/2-iminopropanoate deaminase